MLDYNANRYCPVYRREITADLCYESMMCLAGMFKKSSVRELAEIKDYSKAESICDSCKYNGSEDEDDIEESEV